MQLSVRRAAVAIALVSTLGLVLAGCGSTPAKTGSTGTTKTTSTPVALQETGSSLLYPLFQLWIPPYTGSHKNVTLNAASTGSGTGIADAENGTVQIGASDAYLPPNSPAGMLNIPLAISAQQIMYNVPGFNTKHINLSGQVIDGIYTGKVTNWNDSSIAALNPGVQLPNLKIVPIHRADGSGDTFLFTQFLSKSSSWSSANMATTISWPPVPGSVSATGNGGMVDALAQNKGGIAYVGISYLDQATKKGIGYAALQDKSGNFVLPTQAAIQAEAAGLVAKTPANESISLIFGPGSGAYPIINYEYAIVNQTQSSPAVAKAVRTFLSWAISGSGGNAASFLDQVHFQPLPSGAVTLSQQQIATIK